MRFVDWSFGGAWCDKHAYEVEAGSGMLKAPLLIRVRVTAEARSAALCAAEILAGVIVLPSFPCSIGTIHLPALFRHRV